MLSAADFIRLPYTPDLTQGGIAYATRSLCRASDDRLGGSVFARLRRQVSSVVVELALRRYLDSQGVPFAIHKAAQFTHPERYDIVLGGRRCDVNSYLISKRSQIAQIRRDPALLLRVPALIASDQFVSETQYDQDLLLFGFFSGLVALTAADQQKAREAGQPLYFIHAMPRQWSRPDVWAPLDCLSFKSECDAPISLEICGQDANRAFITTTLHLPPRTLIRAPQQFYAIACLHAAGLPAARIGIHSPLRGEPYLISPPDWGNIWVYGMEITLTGYLTRGEFRRRADFLPQGARVFQYSRMRIKTLSVPIADLHPMDALLDKVKAWRPGRAMGVE